MAALMEAEPMGLQFGLLTGAEPTGGVQDPPRPRPGQPGDQPVPPRHAPVRAHRRGDDHRRRRGDRRPPARRRSSWREALKGAAAGQPPAAAGGDGRAPPDVGGSGAAGAGISMLVAHAVPQVPRPSRASRCAGLLRAARLERAVPARRGALPPPPLRRRDVRRADLGGLAARPCRGACCRMIRWPTRSC